MELHQIKDAVKGISGLRSQADQDLIEILKMLTQYLEERENKESFHWWEDDDTKLV